MKKGILPLFFFMNFATQNFEIHKFMPDFHIFPSVVFESHDYKNDLICTRQIKSVAFQMYILFVTFYQHTFFSTLK